MMKGPWLSVALASPLVASEVRAQARIDEDCPWFDGHFPGNPILPGVAMLMLVENVLQQHCAHGGLAMHISGLRQVRFRRIVRPGETLSIGIKKLNAIPGPGDWTFDVQCEGEMACSGTLATNLDETSDAGSSLRC